MSLLSPIIRTMLLANGEQSQKLPYFDPIPLVRLFNPMGPAVWLASELHADGNTLYGLADLGFGCPELGCFSLREIEGIRLAFGLSIERDHGFRTTHRLSLWAEAARVAHSIPDADLLLRRLERHARSAREIPPQDG